MYCIQCGAKLVKEEKYCRECGREAAIHSEDKRKIESRWLTGVMIIVTGLCLTAIVMTAGQNHKWDYMINSIIQMVYGLFGNL